MNKIIKIFVIVIILLGVLSGIFLVVKKKSAAVTSSTTNSTNTKNIPAANNQGSQALQQQKNTQAQQQTVPNRKTLIRSQWQQCKNKTLSQNTNLFWNIQVTEPIPNGGTYAKGFLDNDQNFIVHVIIKSDAQNPDQIKSRLVAGKMAFVRGTCTDVATDGAVVLQTF